MRLLFFGLVLATSTTASAGDRRAATPASAEPAAPAATPPAPVASPVVATATMTVLLPVASGPEPVWPPPAESVWNAEPATTPAAAAPPTSAATASVTGEERRHRK